MSSRIRSFCLLLCLGLLGKGFLSEVRAADRVSFNRDIRPILADACFQCHGADEKQRKAGLRLDVKDLALKPAESGTVAIVPGKPIESELVKRLLADDDNVRMPPANSGKKITPQQIELLKRWVQEGADYKLHWSYIKPQRPALQRSHTPSGSAMISIALSCIASNS